MRGLAVLIFATLPFFFLQQRIDTLSAGTVVDLSYAFDSETVYWPTAATFHLEKDFEDITEKGYYYSAYKYAAAEHGGTHIDAPVHFARGRRSVNEIPLEQLIGPAIVVDVTKQCANNADYLINTGDFENWEKENGRIAAGTIVLLRTGFGQYYPHTIRKEYSGFRKSG